MPENYRQPEKEGVIQSILDIFIRLLIQPLESVMGSIGSVFKKGSKSNENLRRRVGA